MAVRKLNKNRVTGKRPSVKNGRMVQWESFLERDYYILLEYDPDVIKYQEQPFTINYIHDRKTRRYTPDVFVTRTNKNQVVEVKPESELTDPEVQIKLEAGHQYCLENGYEFRIVTEKDIRSGAILENIKFLYRFSRIQIPVEHQIKIACLLEDFTKGKSIGELSRELSREIGIDCMPYIYSLIYKNKLTFNLDEQVSFETKISVNR